MLFKFLAFKLSVMFADIAQILTIIAPQYEKENIAPCRFHFGISQSPNK